MDKVFAAGAIAFGAVTLSLLTGVAMWLGDAFAVKFMVGSIVCAYLCQWAAGVAWVTQATSDDSMFAKGATALMLVSWGICRRRHLEHGALTDILPHMLDTFQRMFDPPADPRVNAGGVDMPPKADRYDWTTPSGQMPTVIPAPLWDDMERLGWDMRWYVCARQLPVPHS